MRQRKWFFSATILKKNIIRFAAVWIIYSAHMILPRLSVIGISNAIGEASVLSALLTSADLTTAVWINFVYAMVCGMVLFGDLFRSRMCNAFHALPIRREGWFLTNVVTGMLFSFVPNLALALLQIAAYGSYWQIPLLWLGAATMQHLFFFGVAVLAVYLTGKRFAMALLYFLINLFSLLIYWLVESVFGDWLYGISIEGEIFYLLCPLVHMMSFGYVDMDFSSLWNVQWTIGDGWGYLAICAVLGLALLWLALLCYRRRNLEAAGDFLALRVFKSVILVVYSLFVAMILTVFFIPVFIGLIIGFFTGLMLLERTGRVFRKKTFLGAGILVAVYAVSILAVVFDVFGIVRWVPQLQQVRSVQVTVGSQTLLVEDPDQISDILDIHKYALSQRKEVSALEKFFASTGDLTVQLEYTTNSGAKKSREYAISRNTTEGNTLRRYMSSPQAVLGDILDERSNVVSIQLGNSSARNTVQDPEEITVLLNAIVADCNAGHMAQSMPYSGASKSVTIRIAYYDPDGKMQEVSIVARTQSSNMIAWAKQHGIELTWS